jgi:hypothetical protein
MASSGCARAHLSGSILGKRATAKRPDANVPDFIGLTVISEIGTSGPIVARKGGLQRPDTASRMEIGRGSAICENAEIMQILPVRVTKQRL